MGYLEQLKTLPRLMHEAMACEKPIMGLSQQLSRKTDALFLGRGAMYPLALEGALKLKEISYIHAEGYASGELKHGPIALIDKDVPCFFIIGKSGANPNDADPGEIYEKVCSSIEEVRARNGQVIVITDHNDSRVDKLAETVIRIPFVSEYVSPLLKSIPLQLISYHVAVSKGLDPDKPRNLAKSVT